MLLETQSGPYMATANLHIASVWIRKSTPLGGHSPLIQFGKQHRLDQPPLNLSAGHTCAQTSSTYFAALGSEKGNWASDSQIVVLL